MRDQSGPAPRVCLFENHDQSYYVWHDAGMRSRVVLHLDAHDDLEWIKPDRPLHIGNYLCAALRESIAREVIWVVPDGSLALPAERKRLLRRVRQLVRQYPSPRAQIRVEAEGIHTTLLGKPLRVVPLGKIPALDEPVLLDIDVDFMTSPSALPLEPGVEDLPWCWPGELVQALAARGARPELVTVAWSVEGGYTPLRWKYLGDELRDRLRQVDSPIVRSAEKLREAAVSLQQGKTTSAEAILREILQSENSQAAPHYQLALLLRAQGKQAEASAQYHRALELDSSYSTAYNNRGPEYWRRRRFALAGQEYRKTLSLDDSDAYAHFGMAQVLSQRREWAQAETALCKALQKNASLPDAWSLLGDVLARQGRQKESIAAYGTYLGLTLQGKRTLRSPLMTVSTGLLDVGHASAHAKIARLQEKMGDLRAAAQGYHLSIAANRDRAATRLRLARVLVRQGKWGGAIGHAVAGVGRIPGDMRRKTAYWIWRLRRKR